MMDTIRLDADTPADELMVVLREVLSLLAARVGTAPVIATLFGTAVMMVTDDSSNHDR